MSDLIERQAAIDAIIEDKICDDSLKIMTAFGDGGKAETLNMTCDRHAKMLMSLPPVQPERKKGKWIKNDNGTYSCSLCHSWIPGAQYFYAQFCLYCGADMRGEKE